MKDIDLKGMTGKELLELHSKILEELKRKGLIRSKNNPIGDYTEWLVAHKLGLKLVGKSVAGFDASDKNNIKYQIKGRRVTSENKSTQLSAIRNLKNKEFDFLIGVIFNKNYDILYALKMPYDVVSEYAVYRKHVNGHILHLRKTLISDKRIENITLKLK